MTIHEAVEVLEEVKTLDDSMFAYSKAYNDALDIAINALKAQEQKELVVADEPVELTVDEKKEIMKRSPIYVSDRVDVVRCKDCKYFEVKDCWADFAEVPILVSDVPTCHMWGNGECKTRPNGYCFLGERRDGDT